jgi:hypothetical protein
MRRNTAEAKLCEHAKYLAEYLNIDVDPYDFEYMLEKYIEGGPYLDMPEHPEFAGTETVDELSEAQRDDFKEFLKGHIGHLMAVDPLGVPAYLYFEKARMLPPGTWLVHFSRDSFLSFKKGATLETLALSTHTNAKTLTSCEANLDPDSGLYDTVWGFAIEAERLSHRTLRDMKHYGDQVMLFQTDCAVSAWHTTDNFEQVIFPLCSEYNVHRGSYDGHTLSFESTEDDGGEYKEFDSLDEVIEYAEAGKLVPNADRETFAEQIARMRREREAHIERVREEVERTGAYVVQVTDANLATDYPGGWQTITRSTRSGVTWQVTYWQGDPRGSNAIPTGHIDIVGSIEDAAKEVRPRVR